MASVATSPLHLQLSSPPNVFRESDEMHYMRGELQQIEFPDFICDGRAAADIEEERYQRLVQQIQEIDQIHILRSSDPFESIGLPEWGSGDSMDMESSSDSENAEVGRTSSVIEPHYPTLRKIIDHHQAVETESKMQDRTVTVSPRLDWSSKYLGNRLVFEDTSPSFIYNCLRPRLSDCNYDLEDCHTPEQPILLPPGKVPCHSILQLDCRYGSGTIDNDCLEEERIWSKQLECIHTPNTDHSLDFTAESFLDPSMIPISSVSQRLPVEERRQSMDSEIAIPSDLDRFRLNLGPSTFRLIAKHRPFESLIQDPSLSKRQRIVSFHANELSKSSCINESVSFGNDSTISRSSEGNEVVSFTDEDEGYHSVDANYTRSVSAMSYFMSSTMLDSSVVPLYNPSSSAYSNLCTTTFCPTPEGQIDFADIATASAEGHDAPRFNFLSPNVTLKSPRSPLPVRYSKPKPIRLGMDIGTLSMSKNIHVQKYHEMLHSIHIHAAHSVPKLRLRRSSSDNDVQKKKDLEVVRHRGLPGLCDFEDYQMP